MMLMEEYPPKIAQHQRWLLDIEEQVLQLQESVKFQESAYEKLVALDRTLTNETLRKAKKLELIEKDEDYISDSNKLKAMKRQRDELAIELELLRNCFSIAKIKERKAIAELEAVSS